MGLPFSPRENAAMRIEPRTEARTEPSTEFDTTRWSRRDAFAFFRDFDKPYFSVCTRVDVAPLKAALASRAGTPAGRLMLACYFVALRLANVQQPFRLRLQGGRVRELAVVHGSTTVLRPDDSFSFADFDHDDDFERFAAGTAAAIDAARVPGAPFEPRQDAQAVLHFTTLPWVHFTSFSHARNWGREDAVPKLAFGRIDTDGARQWMPLSVEVHHALMDGLHVGRYIEGFEAALRDPGDWLPQRA
jgi:chloramphenicol O-acetyltransferase type A